MFKKLLIILASFLIAFSASAGSDGDLTLNKNKEKQVKDCFEN